MVLTSCCRFDRIEAERYVSKNIEKYWTSVLKCIEDDESQGRVPPIKVYNEVQKVIRWMPFHQKSLYSKLDTIGDKRHLILHFLDSIGDREFEALGCVLSSHLGAKSVKLTTSSDDGGVDFFALFPSHAKNHIFGGPSFSYRIVGQMKNYSNKETITNFKSFIMSINLVKVKHEALKKNIPIWFLDANGPIVGWYISKSGFQSGVVKMAKEQGIILSDAIDVSEALSLSIYKLACGDSVVGYISNGISAILKIS